VAIKSEAAVVTQALSAESYFPLWYRYYSRQVGPQNLFVVAPHDAFTEFRDFELGGILTYPSRAFDEPQRAKFMASLCTGLLGHYATVITVDTDEFLLPDPRKFASLRDFISQNTRPYVTAIGLDVIQAREDPPLDLTMPILIEQRSLAYLTSSLCKTALIRTPVNWGVGFHFCSVYPSMSDLFMFHLKRACVDMQMKWFAKMSEFDLATDQLKSYYKPELHKIEAFMSKVRGWPVDSGWENLPSGVFLHQFFANVKLDLQDSMYRGSHFTSCRLIKLPDEFTDYL